MQQAQLVVPQDFLDGIRALESKYLESDDCPTRAADELNNVVEFPADNVNEFAIFSLANRGNAIGRGQASICECRSARNDAQYFHQILFQSQRRADALV